MNTKFIFYYLLKITGIIGVSLILPMIVSYIYEENSHIYFTFPVIFCVGASLLTLLFKEKDFQLRYRTSLILVALTWVIVSLIGAIPFYLSGYFGSFVNSFFESVSGFTATGSTVLNDIESLPKSILFWRSQTHWLGGMGIIVLVIAVFPEMPGKKLLFESEAPVDPADSKLLPRFSQIAKSYWLIYTILTISQVFLLLPEMNLFDSITHSFASIAGGGFSTKNASVAHFNSVYIESVLAFFMIAGATSFTLHYGALRHRKFNYFRNYSFNLFIGVIVGVTLLIAFINYQHNVYPYFESLRHAFFQVVSIITTTGFATVDFKYWPMVTQVLLLLLMFAGGMSFSTSGSVKMNRYEVLIKVFSARIDRMLHPNSVNRIKVGRVNLPDENISKVLTYIYMYIGVFIVGSFLILAIEDTDIPTAFSSVMATLGNVGPGISNVGPFDNFAGFHDISKVLFTFYMLLGRLEIWTILLLFMFE